MLSTLYLKTENKTKDFLINTESPSCEEVINRLLDFYDYDEWWIE